VSASARLDPSAPFALRIDSLAHGGDGVGRLPGDGRAVFVPRTAPGDLIQAQTVAGKKRELHARALAVIEAGPGRVAPVCPHYDRCGGCQWQHLDLPTQLAAKARTLRESLARVGRLPREELPDIEVIPSPEPLRYRRRARFHLGPGGRLGYVGLDGHSVVELDSCHLLTAPLEAQVLMLGVALQGWPHRSHVRTVEVCEAGGRAALLIELDGSLPSPRSAVAGLMATLPAFTGAVIQQEDRFSEIGEVTLPDGDGLLRPDAFAQANRAASALLVARALELLAPTPADRVLELYCGDGNFTLPLGARAAKVLAVDREGKSLELLRRRAALAGMGNLTLVADEVERVVERLRKQGERFELALLDPPRTGAKGLMEALAFVVTRRIVYVSCDPATLSRDLGALHAQGLRLTALAMVDLFPQTYHLEAIAVLERRS